MNTVLAARFFLCFSAPGRAANRERTATRKSQLPRRHRGNSQQHHVSCESRETRRGHHVVFEQRTANGEHSHNGGDGRGRQDKRRYRWVTLMQANVLSVQCTLYLWSSKQTRTKTSKCTVFKRSNATVVHWFSMHRVALLLLRSLYLHIWIS